jgi:8-oxo-dGTP pyrophosphatase MutT (NUDIX family)
MKLTPDLSEEKVKTPTTERRAMRKDDDRGPQAAALAFRDRKICLVTTRSGKGLIIPKGRVPSGTSAADLAAREAWEEAGLIGQIAPKPFGEYTFTKAGRVQTVQVFLLEVTESARAWPEKRFRRRCWCSPESAIPRVSHVALGALLERFAEFYERSLDTRRSRESA